MVDESEDIFGDGLEDLCYSTATKKRDTCVRCYRPVSVCWCAYLPECPLTVNTTVYILQHPYEETRNLKTAPMLSLGLASGKCVILKGKRFSRDKHPHLHDIVKLPNTLLVYPAPNAEDIHSLTESETPRGEYERFNLILLDGTWPQALGIYQKNTFLHDCRSVMLTMTDRLKRYYPSKGEVEEDDFKSRYVIRSQPTESSLSTVETAALCIAILENRKDVVEAFIKPLDALCQFQLQHGAVRHDCKQFEGSLHKKLFKKQRNKHSLAASNQCS